MTDKKVYMDSLVLYVVIVSIVTLALLFVTAVPLSGKALAVQAKNMTANKLNPLTVLKNTTQTLKTNLDEIRQAVHQGNTAQVLKLLNDADQNVSIQNACMTSAINTMENKTSFSK